MHMQNNPKKMQENPSYEFPIIDIYEFFKAKIKFLPLQKGDVISTFADIKKSRRDLKFKPKIKIKQGIPLFIKWYKSYYKLG